MNITQPLLTGGSIQLLHATKNLPNDTKPCYRGSKEAPSILPRRNQQDSQS